ncbi:hypothetical protein CK203_070738 [Vitis vinifera]|uniref:RING-type E3 ubiquitin transferase n=1 Tax=Vitis vinifera TaxID=29760 RepID=A0A438C163_VITVI|nr:hypothetical protein CK203_070738 [Vitis vinifera]
MYPLLSVIVFLLSLNMGTQTLGESTDDDFFELCQETRCSTRGGPRIRFPFRLNTQPDFCGLEGFVVSCLNNRTLLHLPFSERVSWSASDGIVVPIDCLSYDKNLVYLYDPFVSMNKLPSHCRRFKTVEIISVHGYVELQQAIERLFERQEIFLAWEGLDGCYECENSGNFCGFNSTRNATICSTSRPKRQYAGNCTANANCDDGATQENSWEMPLPVTLIFHPVL